MIIDQDQEMEYTIKERIILIKIYNFYYWIKGLILK